MILRIKYRITPIGSNADLVDQAVQDLKTMVLPGLFAGIKQFWIQDHNAQSISSTWLYDSSDPTIFYYDITNPCFGLARDEKLACILDFFGDQTTTDGKRCEYGDQCFQDPWHLHKQILQRTATDPNFAYITHNVTIDFLGAYTPQGDYITDPIQYVTAGKKSSEPTPPETTTPPATTPTTPDEQPVGVPHAEQTTASIFATGKKYLPVLIGGAVLWLLLKDGR